MAPDHIDDLPRREDDNRQLMLGLIDDLPQERRGTRQLMMWGLGLAAAVLPVCCSGLGHGAKLVIVDPSRPPRGGASAANQLIRKLRPKFQICAKENAASDCRPRGGSRSGGPAVGSSYRSLSSL